MGVEVYDVLVVVLQDVVGVDMNVVLVASRGVFVFVVHGADFGDFSVIVDGANFKVVVIEFVSAVG